MKFHSTPTILGAMAATALCLAGVALAGGQAPATPAPVPAPTQVMAEDAFKNVQVLKGYSVPQFMEAMGFFCASLGQSCEYCHDLVHGTWDDYATDNAHKNMARKMVLMMTAINKANFGGRRAVTCYSCHGGSTSPKITPSLALVYGTPSPEDPNDVPLGDAPKGVTADQILDKYLQAIGGAQRLAALTSFTAKGISVGYGDEAYDRPVEIFAKAPAQRSTVIHTLSGDNTTTFDGRAAWVAAPATAAPVPVLALAGTDLDGARIDAALSFPAQLKTTLTGWRVGEPTTIDDKEVQIVQGMAAPGRPVRLFFDKTSGLLVRQLRFTDSPIGLNPLQIDYSDYRAVAGVKMPYRWVVTWLDGMATFTMSDVQANAAVDAAKFNKPAPPAPPPPKPAVR